MKRLLIIILTLLILAISGLIAIEKHMENEKPVLGPVHKSEVAGVSYDYDISYKKSIYKNCKMDVAFKKDGEKHPLLILVHGGAWVTGDKESLNDFFHTFAGRDYTVANINYDLISFEKKELTKMTIAEQENQISAAMDYLLSHTQEYAIDEKQIYIAGHSAGGQLVGNLIEKGQHPIQKAILISTASSFRHFLYHQKGPTSDLNVSLVLIPFMFDGKVDSDIITEIEKVDVLSNLTPDMPETLIIHGDLDETLPYTISQNLYEAMVEKGCKAHLEIIHGMGHNPKIEEICEQMDDFLKERKGKK